MSIGMALRGAATPGAAMHGLPGRGVAKHGAARRGYFVRLSRTITQANRSELVRAVELAPLGSRIDLVTDLRTLAQNRMLWMLLSQLSEQHPHGNPPEHYDAEAWKAAFLKAQGAELRFMPGLDGESVVCVGYRSSKLSKEQFSELIERVFEFGARHGVTFHGPKGEKAA